MPILQRHILVTGATGQTGAPLVQLLTERGVRVRALTRNAAATVPTGVELVAGDFADPASLTRALTDVDAAYLVTPSSAEAEAHQLRFVELAQRAGVKHIVKLSQLAAHAESPVRFLRYHAVVEQKLRSSGMTFTMLRPNLYFQGFLNFASSIAQEGKFFAPIGEARVSATDVRDIAAVAAAALIDKKHEGQTYTITGPAALTHGDIAEALSRALSRPVQFVDVPPAAFAAAARAQRMPDWQVDGLVEDYAHYARGEASEVTDVVSQVTGKPARSVDDFARDYARSFQG